VAFDIFILGLCGIIRCSVDLQKIIKSPFEVIYYIIELEIIYNMKGGKPTMIPAAATAKTKPFIATVTCTSCNMEIPKGEAVELSGFVFLCSVCYSEILLCDQLIKPERKIKSKRGMIL